ncbi:CBS domain-containing protein [Kitasatospora cathayae]|uniref:CBS domain-containing protein n=2 Tax=Kitasatospora cathayae TaxID=3004092 RepID=A0ABY7QFA7_9ACTN|nr:CBS domain-containing protein [Kitasatospora sp. HUAS 3-15]WBP91428.1 CBS domain-containing protein [Kitasatospora sp. HUAS 3-15]
MTREVATARPDTPFKEIAALFHRNDITTIPVIDDQGCPLRGVAGTAHGRRQDWRCSRSGWRAGTRCWTCPTSTRSSGSWPPSPSWART